MTTERVTDHAVIASGERGDSGTSDACWLMIFNGGCMGCVVKQAGQAANWCSFSFMKQGQIRQPAFPRPKDIASGGFLVDGGPPADTQPCNNSKLADNRLSAFEARVRFA